MNTADAEGADLLFGPSDLSSDPPSDLSSGYERRTGPIRKPLQISLNGRDEATPTR